MALSLETDAGSLAGAAHAADLSPRTIRRYVERGLLEEAPAGLDLERLARIRRLTGLGINLAGVEIILRMRRQIVELQQALARERQCRPWPRPAASEGDYRPCAAPVESGAWLPGRAGGRAWAAPRLDAGGKRPRECGTSDDKPKAHPDRRRR